MNNKFNNFKLILEEIDRDYGFGPNEEIIDESKTLLERINDL